MIKYKLNLIIFEPTKHPINEQQKCNERTHIKVHKIDLRFAGYHNIGPIRCAYLLIVQPGDQVEAVENCPNIDNVDQYYQSVLG